MNGKHIDYNKKNEVHFQDAANPSFGEKSMQLLDQKIACNGNRFVTDNIEAPNF